MEGNGGAHNLHFAANSSGCGLWEATGKSINLKLVGISALCNLFLNLTYREWCCHDRFLERGVLKLFHQLTQLECFESSPLII